MQQHHDWFFNLPTRSVWSYSWRPAHNWSDPAMLMNSHVSRLFTQNVFCICQFKLTIRGESLRLQIRKCLWLSLHHTDKNFLNSITEGKIVYVFPFPLVSKCKIIKSKLASSLISVTHEAMNIGTWILCTNRL